MSNAIVDHLRFLVTFSCPSFLTLLSVLSLVFTCRTVLIVLYRQFRKTKLLKARLSHSAISGLRVLSKLCIPACSIWPEYYLDATWLPYPNLKHIRIPCSVLLKDIQQGKIELRKYLEVLSSLLRATVVLDGWKVDLDISLGDRVNSLIWALREELRSISIETLPLPSAFSDRDAMKVDAAILARYWSSEATGCLQDSRYERTASQERKLPSQDTMHSSIDRILCWPSLDMIPRSRTEAYIRRTQRYLHRTTGESNISILSFTTSELSLSPIDRNFVLAAFALSNFFNKNSVSLRRTSSPLFTSLAQIIALLTSSPHSLRVLRLSDASELFAKSLDFRAAELDCNGDTRRGFIDAYGLQRWREELLSLRWEAGLLRAGILTRWITVVEVNR